MSRNLFISLEALKLAIRIQLLQSPEYEETIKVIYFIQNKNAESFYLNGLMFENHSNGHGYIFTKKKDTKQGVVFNISNLISFSNDFKLGETILVFQKTLKYALKFFNGTALARNERNISGDITVIYPFKFTAQKNVFKVIVYKNPLQARMERREQKYLFVFADGHDEVSETPVLTDFRKVIDSLPEVTQKSILVGNEGEQVQIHSMSVLSLGEITYSEKNGKQKDTISELYFTKKQSEFISKPFAGCERLEGAAGTGKTLTLILRTITNLKNYLESLDEEKHIAFITHSVATRKQIETSFEVYFPEVIDLYNRSHTPVSLKIITLQEWCLNFLGSDDIAETEYLDLDAQNSKELQLLYILESYEMAIRDDFESFKPFCSSEFIDFIESHSSYEIIELLQFEIGVTIKGRARQDLEQYMKIERLENSIPASIEGDFNFLYLVYTYYQKQLTKLGQFDSDDIALTALGALSTPIWRRRRESDGYDVVVVDETHLFNINELSIIHHLSKPNIKKQNNTTSIVFAIDKSQAVGDSGMRKQDLEKALNISKLESSSNYHTIFRSSPAIVDLAFSVLASGASIFTNFENPMEVVHFSFTSSEESKCTFPKYLLYASDEEMIDKAFGLVGDIAKKDNIAKSRILLIATLPELLENMVNYAEIKNKPVEVLRRRGDTETVSKASLANKFLIAGIDYVGGLEFDAVIIVGVDEGRVPLMATKTNSEGYHFNNYAWHNRLYVAITRAKYQLYVLGIKSRGESPILKAALDEGLIDLEST